MRYYFAGADAGGDYEVFGGFTGVSFLVSYWYILNGKGWDTVKYARNNDIPLFLDCGAFSALMSGAKIDILEYIGFVKKHQKTFEVVASLDVIGDWEATKNNHLMMREAGVNTIPTFHVNSPFEALVELLQDNDYIALGVAGMQQRRNGLMRWLIKCFQLKQEHNPNGDYHGFALTSSKIMSSFRWRSVDSTSWIAGRQYGILLVRNGKHIYTTGRDDQRGSKYRDVFPPRNGSRKDYEPALKHNIKTVLDWVGQ